MTLWTYHKTCRTWRRCTTRWSAGPTTGGPWSPQLAGWTSLIFIIFYHFRHDFHCKSLPFSSIHWTGQLSPLMENMMLMMMTIIQGWYLLMMIAIGDSWNLLQAGLCLDDHFVKLYFGFPFTSTILTGPWFDDCSFQLSFLLAFISASLPSRVHALMITNFKFPFFGFHFTFFRDDYLLVHLLFSLTLLHLHSHFPLPWTNFPNNSLKLQLQPQKFLTLTFKLNFHPQWVPHFDFQKTLLTLKFKLQAEVYLGVQGSWPRVSIILNDFVNVMKLVHGLLWISWNMHRTDVMQCNEI